MTASRIYQGHTRTKRNADLDLLPHCVPRGRRVLSLPEFLANNAVFNVRDQGAVGNGIADDTDAILETIEQSLTADGNYGAILFPRGIYRTALIEVSAANLLIYGPGSSSQNGTQVTLKSIAGGPILKVLSADNPTFSIRNIGFLGDQNVGGGIGSLVDGIELDSDAGGNLDSTVQDCSFLGLRKCIIGAGRNLQVYDSTFANAQRGVQIESAPIANRAHKIKRNHFHGMGALDADADIYVNDPAAYNIIVDDNFRDEGHYGKFFFAVSGVDRVSVTRNRIDRVRNTAIELGTATNLDISDNFIYGEAPGGPVTNSRGIVVGAITSGRIADNTILRVWKDGIVSTGVCVALRIDDNTIMDAGNGAPNTCDGIAVTPGGSKNGIDGNTILSTSGSTRYGISGGAGWGLGINDVTSTSTADYNGTFDNSTQSFGGSGVAPGNFGAAQAGRMWMGAGVPNNAKGSNGDAYFRTDTPGTANQRLYFKNAGVWAGVL